MTEQTEADLNAQTDAWREKYKDQVDDFVFAKIVEHDQRLNALVVNLSTGRRLPSGSEAAHAFAFPVLTTLTPVRTIFFVTGSDGDGLNSVC
jgi:hypothetical protein